MAQEPRLIKFPVEASSIFPSDIGSMVETVETGEIPIGTPEAGYSTTHKEFHPTDEYARQVDRIRATIIKGFDVLSGAVALSAGDYDAVPGSFYQDPSALELAKLYMASDGSFPADLKALETIVRPVQGEDAATKLFMKGPVSSSTVKSMADEGTIKAMQLLYELGDMSLPAARKYEALSELQAAYQKLM